MSRPRKLVSAETIGQISTEKGFIIQNEVIGEISEEKEGGCVDPYPEPGRVSKLYFSKWQCLTSWIRSRLLFLSLLLIKNVIFN